MALQILLKYKSVVMLVLTILYVDFAYAEMATKTDLNAILNKSFKTENKKDEVLADSSIEWLNFIPGLSPWASEFNASIENLWSDAERAGLATEYQALNLTSTVNQRTPYGLALNLNFERLLNVPEIENFLIKERMSANLALSLYNDFLGANTAKVLQATEQKNKKIFDDKIRLQNCERIANQFFTTFLNEQNYAINLESTKDIEFIQKRLSPNAVTAQDYLSLTIDKAQLESRLVKSAQQFQSSQLSLSDLARIPIEEIINLTLSSDIDGLLKQQEQQFQIIERLDLEIEILQARKKLLDLNQRNDISLYAGLRSQQLASFDDSTTSSVVGLNFNWNFGNIQIENSKQSIDFEITKRKIQKEHLVMQKAKITTNFQTAITGQANTLKVMQKASENSDKLQDIARKNFLNGRIGFFEFLTLRNQVNSVKTEYVQALIDFYKIYLDQSVYSGNVESACFGISI